MTHPSEDGDETFSWFDAGYQLAIHWTDEVERHDRRAAAEELKAVARVNREEAVLVWLKRFRAEYLSRVPESGSQHSPRDS